MLERSQRIFSFLVQKICICGKSVEPVALRLLMWRRDKFGAGVIDLFACKNSRAFQRSAAIGSLNASWRGLTNENNHRVRDNGSGRRDGRKRRGHTFEGCQSAAAHALLVGYIDDNRACGSGRYGQWE